MCCLTSPLQEGWKRTGNSQGSRKVTRCVSRGKNSTFSTLNDAICSRAVVDLSMRSRSCGGSTAIRLSISASGCNRPFPLTRCPYEIAPLVPSSLKVRHDAVHYMRLWSEKVYRINISIIRPPMLNLLNVYVSVSYARFFLEVEICIYV